MAKKRAKSAEAEGAVAVAEEPESGEIPKGQLGDWRDKVPKEVQDAVDEYMQLYRDANKARLLKNAAEDRCKAVMREHGVERVPIDELGKYLVASEVTKLKTQKIKDQEE